MNGTPLVFVDIETTGVSPRTGGRVIEVAALRMENHHIVDSFTSFINPEVPVPYFITNITGIRDKHVESAPVFRDLSTRIDQITQDAVFVAHNVGFDYGFLQEEFKKCGESFTRMRLCTVQLSRALHPFERGHSLAKLIERHGYSVVNRHRAYDDAEVLYRFFEDMHTKDPIKLSTHANRLIK